MRGRPEMDIRQLAIFVSIANHGTFTAAGKALYISQPTVSVQMAASRENWV